MDLERRRRSESLVSQMKINILTDSPSTRSYRRLVAMLSLVSCALSLNARGAVLGTSSMRAPAVSMNAPLESKLIYDTPVPLGKTLGCVLGSTTPEGVTGAIVPTSAAAIKTPAPIENTFIYESRDSLGATLGMTFPYKGEVVLSKKVTTPKAMESKFCYGPPASSPPCGVAHHDGSPS